MLALVALSLVVMSVLHLAGHIHGRGAAFDGDDAGVAEAIIAAVLAGGAMALFRSGHRARTAGLAATSFAIAGFGIGLTETARAGHLPDIAYHVLVLPILVGSFMVLRRVPSASSITPLAEAKADS